MTPTRLAKRTEGPLPLSSNEHGVPWKVVAGICGVVGATALVLLLLAGLVWAEALELGSVTPGQLIVVALRLVLPLLILRWWLLGGIAALVIDALDVVIVEFFGPGGMGDHYSQLDKGLDSYYLALEALVAWFWVNPWARWAAIGLFAYRLVGAVLFEVTQARALLFVFPNLFENLWLYCVIMAKWWPDLLPRSWRSTSIPLLLLLIPKLGQEYLLHVTEAQPWDWLKDNVL